MTKLKHVCVMLGLLVACGLAAQTTYVNNAKTFKGPIAYKDKESGTVFYVESDGRHVAAIDSEGKVLWNKDPFVDGKLEPYRVKNPQIVFIGAVSSNVAQRMKDKGSGRFIGINFNSSQFGYLDVKDGAFTFAGQD